MIGQAVLAISLGYLVGSFPSAYIAGRLLKGVDIREVGDGNMGAQNTYRQISHKAGIAVGLVDAAKGAGAILIARAFNVPEVAVLLAGLTAVMGHNWPIFLHFRGGRGEATTIGIMTTLMPREMLILLGVALVPFAFTRNVTFASVFLFAPLALVAWGFGVPGTYIIYSIALPCLVGLTHLLATRRTMSNAMPKGT